MLGQEEGTPLYAIALFSGLSDTMDRGNSSSLKAVRGDQNQAKEAVLPSQEVHRSSHLCTVSLASALDVPAEPVLLPAGVGGGVSITDASTCT